MKFLKNFTRALFDVSVAPQRLVGMGDHPSDRADMAAEQVGEAKDAIKEAAKAGLTAANDYLNAKVDEAVVWAEGFRQRAFVEPWATGKKETRRIAGAVVESTVSGSKEAGRIAGRGAEAVGDVAGTVAEGTVTGYREYGRAVGRAAPIVAEGTATGYREIGRAAERGAEAVTDFGKGKYEQAVAGIQYEIGVLKGGAQNMADFGQDKYEQGVAAVRGKIQEMEEWGKTQKDVAKEAYEHALAELKQDLRELEDFATATAETVSDVVAVTRDIAAEEAAPLVERFEQGLAERRGQVTQELFVAAVEAEVVAPQEKTVTVESLNIRTAPSIHADRTGVLKKGEKVTIALDPPPVEQEDGFKWALCDKGGWVAIGKSDGSADYLG